MKQKTRRIQTANYKRKRKKMKEKNNVKYDFKLVKIKK